MIKTPDAEAQAIAMKNFQAVTAAGIYLLSADNREYNCSYLSFCDANVIIILKITPPDVNFG